MAANDHRIIIGDFGQILVGTPKGQVPMLFREAGESATRRFIEFFTANIRNKNTREAYARAI